MNLLITEPLQPPWAPWPPCHHAPMGTPTWHPGYTLPGTHGYTHLYTMHEAALLYRTLKNTIYMQLFAKPVSQKEVNTMVAVY